MALLALVVLPVAGLAEETPWQKSYRLEAAKKYVEASAVLDRIEGGADDDFLMMRRGWLAYLQGRYNEAYGFYKNAIQINPNTLDGRLGIILPLLAQQRWREAASYAQQVIEKSGWNYTAHLYLMAAEEGLRDWRTLAAHAEQLSRHYPADAAALVYLARAHAWMGNVKTAREAYGRVLIRMPGHGEAAAYLNANP